MIYSKKTLFRVISGISLMALCGCGIFRENRVHIVFVGDYGMAPINIREEEFSANTNKNDPRLAFLKLVIDTNDYSGPSAITLQLGSAPPGGLVLPTTGDEVIMCSKSGLVINIKQAPHRKQIYVLSLPSGYTWILASTLEQNIKLNYYEYNAPQNAFVNMGEFVFKGDEKNPSVARDAGVNPRIYVKAREAVFSSPKEMDVRKPPDFKEFCLGPFAGF